MFKDFTSFNGLSSLLFKDEPFNLILAAFRSFQSMLVALRTQAYDYTTWYNKVMRDKYEDGEPVDITQLPYLSVPRSQLAVMRARILKVKEAVQYAAAAITNVALGFKVSAPQLASYTDSLTTTISATESSPIIAAIKKIIYCIGDIVVNFDDGSDSVTVNGVTLSVSPLVRGTVSIAKVKGNKVGFPSNYSIGGTSGRIRNFASQLIRSFLQTPLVVARNAQDLDPESTTPIGVMIMNRPFFNKRLIVWAETVGSGYDQMGHVFRVFETSLHAKLVDSGEEKRIIASSLYGYLSEDYAEAMSYSAPTTATLVQSIYTQASGIDTYLNSTQIVTSGAGNIVSLIDVASTDVVEVFGQSEDVSQATTQTAIADIFYTPQEWDDLYNSLQEA